MRRIFSSSFIRLTRVCSRPAVSTRIGSRPLRLAGRDRVEDDRGRIRALAARGRCRRPRASPRSRAARRPRRETCRRRKSAAVCPSFLSRLASLPTVVVLPVPLTPTISDDLRTVRRRRPADRPPRTCARISSFTRSRRLSPSRAPSRDGRDDPVGRRDADVGGDQQLFERLERLDVDRTASGAQARRPGGRSRRSGRRSAAWCGRDCRGSGRRNPMDDLDHGQDPARSVDPGRARAVQDPPRFRRCGGASARRAPSARRLRPSSTSAICVGDRQLDAVARAERERGAGRPHAFGDHLHAGENLVRADVRAPSSMPTWRLRLSLPGARQHQIAEAAQAGERLAPAAGGAREPRDFGQPARDERRQRVVAEASPSTTPAAIAMTFFSAPPISTPTTSSLPYEPEVRAAKLRPGRGRRPLASDDAATTAVGSSLRDLQREARSRQHDDRMRRARAPPRSLPTCAAACRPRAPWSR